MFSLCPDRSTSDRSRGANSLIRQGAKLVESIDDVLVEFSYLQPGQREKRSGLTPQGIPKELSGEEGVSSST